MFKAAFSAIVWIRDAKVTVMSAKSHKWLDFRMKPAARIESPDVGQIRFVHGHNEIKRGEIILVDLSGLTGDRKAMAGESFGHPWIRRGTLMVANGACGIDLKVVDPAGIGGELPEDDLRRR